MVDDAMNSSPSKRNELVLQQVALEEGKSPKQRKKVMKAIVKWLWIESQTIFQTGRGLLYYV